jgi:hypothetical protein
MSGNHSSQGERALGFEQDRLPEVGERVAGRYLVERLAARGGMGTVFRASDELSGDPVALKIVPRDGGDAARFGQEARLLSELRHPAIVRYLGHGQVSHGLSFLAMEWLEGEDLSQRLARAGLGVVDALAIVRRVAEGLAAVHARGLVHRDIKPGNIRLVGSDPARATLIDFGIAHVRSSGRASPGPPMTGTGVILGTVEYMSPEQATGDRALDPRADVFALGCVLFECLTGEPAFSGVHVMAVLAKILREQAPRVRDRRPELPPALDDLVAKMLSKDRAARPVDAAAVVAALDALGSVEGGIPEAIARRLSGLSGGEQRPVSVMLALVPGQAEQVEALVERFDGELARLANGALLVTLGGRGTASDQVMTASACALALRDAFPGARVGLSTGWAPTTGGPPGPIIDLAASLLARAMSPGVRVDEVTAGLLGERFELRNEGHAFLLVGRRVEIDAPRTLLGRATPCVGRDREIELLDGTLRECVTECVARAVVVTGPAGQGKSRLLHELLLRVNRRGDDVRVLGARGDPVAPGSALAIARQLVRQGVRLPEGLPEADQRRQLAAHVQGTCAPSEAPWVTEFLAELIGLAAAEGVPGERFRAARNDPRIMGDWLRRAFGAWMAALCAERPLLVVIDDLQWGDAPSLAYLTDALRALASRPFMALALGRAELRDAFPDLWANLDRLDLALGRLAPRAAERLARIALGEKAEGLPLARIVDRADGNAFYLEELVRRVAEGPADTLPGTVLALVHSRIERLEPDARRVVRAASVFGNVFWRGGVAALLGDAADLPSWLRALETAEIFEPSPQGRFPGETELGFRSDLLRLAAYETLTGADREKGHLLAGEWLEGVGERDALSLGEHFYRGGDRARALPWLARAAHTALKGGGFWGAVELCERALELGPDRTEQGKLLQTEGLALAMSGDLAGCADRLRAAIACFEPGSTRWFACVAALLLAGTFLGDAQLTAPLLQVVVDPSVRPEPSGPYGVSVYAACVGLAMVGHLDAASAFLGRAESLAPGSGDVDPVFSMALGLTRASIGLARGEVGAAIRSLSEARATAERTGDASGLMLVALHESAAFAEAGDEEKTEAAARDLARLARQLGAASFADWGTLSVAQARLAGGRGGELVDSLAGLLDRLDPMFVTVARGILSRALLAAGDVEGAARAARRVLEDASMVPGAQATALGTLALIGLRRAPAEAVVLAQQGIDAASRVGSPHDVSILLLARAEALAATGRAAEAASALDEARDRVLRVASSLDDPALREAYLTRVEANARTLALARERAP